MKNDHLSKSHNITAHTTVQTRQVQKPKLGQLAWSTRFLLSLLYQNFCVIENLYRLLCTTRYTHVIKCSYFFLVASYEFEFVCLKYTAKKNELMT